MHMPKKKAVRFKRFAKKEANGGRKPNSGRKTQAKSKTAVKQKAETDRRMGRRRKAKATRKTDTARTIKSQRKAEAKRKAKARRKRKAKLKYAAIDKTKTRPKVTRARKAQLKKKPQYIYAEMLSNVLAANTAVVGTRVDQSRVVVEPTRDPTHGDMAANSAMVLAKSVGKNPRELAEAIAEKLRVIAIVEQAVVAGPGFINLTLKRNVWVDELRRAIKLGGDYGRSTMGQGEKVNVEYVSANPTGPLHVGHGRGAVFGDALANLLAFAGYDVTREYYINDAGAQVDTLARSAYHRYQEALGEAVGDIADGLYPGEYLRHVGGELAAEYGAKLSAMKEIEWLPVVRSKAVAMMMDLIRADLAALNITFDVYFSERALIDDGDQVAATIQALRKSGEVYEGRLPPPKGAPIEDWEDREQTLFRSTQFGDDVDRPLKKSDGSYTYFASDIAYHKSKVERGFRNLIDVWGADHGGYIKRMQAAVKAVSGGKATLDVKLIQLVKLMRAGEPVKMSKRAGEFITLREVVEEVGKDAVRFDMLFRKNDAPLEFDLAKVVETTRENPVFYVQYGHARAQSVFRNAREALPDLPAEPEARARWLQNAPLDRLSDSGELLLLRKLALYPRTVEAASAAHEPHRIAFYLYELASEFHAQWTRGNDLPHLRFIIQNDPETTKARLALVEGIAGVLASGLAMLGVGAPQEMR
jgi:arginyl-tRNA synthetase